MRPKNNPMDRMPNILYVLADEHCGFALGHAGDPNLNTPHLDRLAGEGVSFKRAYANSPICTPSRGTIFSGRHAHAGPIQNFFDVYKPAAPSTATILRQHGYHTAYFGKWHMGVVRDQISPDVRRNPEAYPEIQYFRRTPEHHRGGFQDWFAFELNNAPFDLSYYAQSEVNPRKLEGYQTDALADLLLEYLGDYEREAPLFAVLSVEPPHFPFEAPEAFMRFDPEALQTRPNFVDSPEMRANLAIYYAMIENLDWNIGRLLEGLSRLPLFRDNTLVVYFSDHGEFMGSHGLMGRKEHPHEESVRIPAIFHWPGRIQAQGLAEELFSLVDLLPTTLGLANLPIPSHVQGANLAPACLGERMPGPGQVLLEMSCNPRWGLDFVDWRGLVTRRWKYVHYETGHELLFDLEADPNEQNNLIEVDPIHRERLRNALLELLDATAEPYYQVLMAFGVEPDGPVVDVSGRTLGEIAPVWRDVIKRPEG